MRRVFASLLLVLAPFSNAWSISVADLPAQLQSCMGSHACVVDTSGPVASIGTMEAYRFYDNLSGLPTVGYALRYSLLTPSGAYDNNTLASPYAGEVWLTLQDSYDLIGGANQVTVYTDTVTPMPGNLLNDSDGLDIDIDLTNTALLSGHGFVNSGLDLNNNVSFQGNMDLQSDFGGSALLFCVAEGCGAGAVLNLLYLKYLDAGNGTAILVFNPGDTRALLYQLTSAYDEAPSNGGFDYRQSYYVAAVPVPAAFWLFMSGLAMLGGCLRRFRD
jgi:hypothetical protein